MNRYKHQHRELKDSDLMRRCKALLDAGKRVQAVRLYRTEMAVSLPAAMQALGLR